ncbi:uncharacterized protein LOC123689651 [Pieris rapae]|uniref:uncharacterized protein LOC123689651 n=1 Tax=Pieris rapae TaxID=64459 RepID=UPI001E27FCCF|nr:uncharacterized protein LOC123689651 [Pieris rapae]
MGAFVLFLFLILIYINENIATISNEQTIPFNVKSNAPPTDSYNIPIRRYKEEYYDPFLEDIYSEKTHDKKEFLDGPYTFYKDDNILNSERFYFKLPLQSGIYNEYIAFKGNPKISPENDCLQSKINYNDSSPQDEYPSKEMGNSEKRNWSNRKQVLKSKTNVLEDFSLPKEIAKIPRNPGKFYGNNNYTSDYYARLENNKSNEHRISKPEYDAHLKLHDNSFMQIPLKSQYRLDNAYIPHTSPIEECRGVNKKYYEFAERIPVDSRHLNQNPGRNLSGNYRTPNEADEFKDQTHLKHSLTSSASAVENRLLTSHITNTFEKVKGDDENKPDGLLNDIRFWKSPSNKKYMNSLNLNAENHTKSIQSIIEQSNTTLASPKLPQQIASQKIYKTNPFESKNTNDSSSFSATIGVTEISLSDQCRSRLNEIPNANHTCTETRHENCFSKRKMEEMNPANFLRQEIQTTANQFIPFHYNMAKNSKSIGETQEPPQNCDKGYKRPPTFDVKSKLINDWNEPINVNNGSNKQAIHDMLNLDSSKPLNDYSDIRNYTAERIKAFYYPSNIKSSIFINGNKNNVNWDCIRTNAEGVFIQPNLQKDKPFVKSKINTIVPESIDSSINQVPRCYDRINNLPLSQGGDTMDQDGRLVHKIPEVNPLVDESIIIQPNSIWKKDRSNSIKFYPLPKHVSLPSPINHNNQDNRRMYSSPIHVQPFPIQVYPQQTTINIKSTHNTPVVSAATYTVQAPNNSFYEINKPKITILNPTNAQNPEGYKNPTPYYIPSTTYKQTKAAINASKVQLPSQNDTKLNPIKSTSSNVNILENTPVNKYNSLLSDSLNNITSAIVSNILSSFNKDISKTLKKPLSPGSNVYKLPISCEIPTFEVTHPCIESPRYLPETPIKIRKDSSTSTAINKSSKPSVSTITINVLPTVQQKSNDIIILV